MNTESQIANFTELIATAIENAEARTRADASRARIVATADQTRRRIERDLHDGAWQRLVSLALQLRAAQAAVPPERAELGAQLDHVRTELTDALDELREMARGVHPAILAKGGLAPALKALARRSPIPVDLVVGTQARLPEQVEVTDYYIRRQGARERRQARPSVSSHGHRRGRRTTCCMSRFGTTAWAAPTSPAAPVSSASEPRGGARRPDLSRQPACSGDHPSRRAPGDRCRACTPS